MTGRIRASAVAGLFGGVAFGVLMQLMMVPTPDGEGMPMLSMVGQIIGTPTIATGWTYHLINSAVIGAIFGWLLGRRVHDYASGIRWGAAYGFAWWILGGLILMPILLGMPAFAPLTTASMRLVAAASLVGHLIYGLILGAAYAWLHLGLRQEAPLHRDPRRTA